jgi:hypothetical protein
MTFVPILTPGRHDNLGPMQVPHDIYEFVTTDPDWVNEIETHSPNTRQAYLASIKYWMVTNGACVVRSASSGKFKLIQSINACNTILMGNEMIDGMEGPGGEGGGPPGPPPPDTIYFSISVNPEADTCPITTTLTIDRGSDVWIDAFFIDWGDGNTQTVSYSELVPLQHTYTIVGDYELRVQPLDPSGDNYGNAETKLITSRID